MNTELTAFNEMQTDIQISMDDVVSAFVSQYESNLYAKKKELGAVIKGLEKELESIDETVLVKITGDDYAKERMPFGLKLKVEKGALNWPVAEVFFSITIKEEGTGRYGNTITLSKSKKIPAAQIKAQKKTSEKLSDVRADLSEVLVSLKSVTRKERQVRGRIAMRKLEDSGYASLMQDNELIKLVQLEDS